MAIGPVTALIGHKYSPRIQAPTEQRKKPTGEGIFESFFGRKKRKMQAASRRVTPWSRGGVPGVFPTGSRVWTNVRYVPVRPMGRQVPIRGDPRFALRYSIYNPRYMPQWPSAKIRNRGATAKRVWKTLWGNLV